MAIPGVEGASLVGKAPDVNRQHDSNQQQQMAAQASQEADTNRRAQQRRRRVQAAHGPDQMVVSDREGRSQSHFEQAPRDRHDPEINSEDESSQHAIDARA